jgi:DNA-binding NarL/FixJ family response regulator
MNKIFIVEDSAMIRDRLHCAIADIKAAVMVGEADSEEGALKMIPAVQAEIVVLDLLLAKGSGIEVLRQLKKLMPAIKVMVLTNHAYPQYRQECLKLGADCFLDKSKDFSMLAGVLRDWIEVSQSREHAA